MESKKEAKCLYSKNSFIIRLTNIEQVVVVTCSKYARNYFLLDGQDYLQEVM